MRSLSSRVAVAGGIVAAVLLGLVGATSFVAIRVQIRQNLHEAATNAAEIEGRRLGAILQGVQMHLASTAANPLIANALTDSVGRQAYVVPFLNGISTVQALPVRVVMTDYRGRPIAGGPSPLLAEGIIPAAQAAIATSTPVGKLAADQHLLFAAPIIYANTATAEGALVYEINLGDLKTHLRDSHLISQIFVEVSESGETGSERGTWGVGRDVEDLGNGLHLVVTAIGSPDAFSRPQTRLLLTFASLGAVCLVVVVLGSITVGRTMTRQLRDLEGDSARVVATGSFSERFRMEGDDEVARLARSFNQVLDRLEAAHRDLAAQAARDLKESEERYRILAEHASDIISRIGADGMVRYVSPAVTRVLGYEMSQVAGGRLRELIHPEDSDAVVQAMAKPAPGGGATHSFRMLRHDGTYVWVEASWHELGGDGAGHDDRVVIIRDVTRRREAEEALAARTEDLQRSNAELEQFAYVASHDLREPLRMVANYLQLVDRHLGDAKDADIADFMGFALDGARRMDRLILDLLEYARVGRNRPPAEPVPLSEVVEDAVATLAALAEERGAEITVEQGFPVVEGDRAELERLLVNLVGNSLKYTPADRAPKVHVGWRIDGGEVVLSVADNGIGIAREHRDRIFLIFQRLHSRGTYEGTGVGLAICKKIVDLHQGRIWVEEADGGGSVFLVALPLPKPAAACRPAAMAEA